MSIISLQNGHKLSPHAQSQSLAHVSGDVLTLDPLELLLHHRHTGAPLLLQLVLQHMPEVLNVFKILSVARPFDHFNPLVFKKGCYHASLVTGS